MKHLIELPFGNIEVEMIKAPTSSERGQVKVTIVKDQSTRPVTLSVENGRNGDKVDLIWN